MLIIGDVHGKLDQYISLVKEQDRSVQVGDMGFNYQELSQLNHKNHIFIPGNHDNYDNLPLHALGDFGHHTTFPVPFFYVRGADSVDKQYRLPYISWWPNEQLSYSEGQDCLNLYEMIKPDLVISHDCPLSVLKCLHARLFSPNGSFTNQLLDEMWNIHQPNKWIFGHHHMDVSIKLDDTEFICLDELSSLEIK
jgi:hypothetical protein